MLRFTFLLAAASLASCSSVKTMTQSTGKAISQVKDKSLALFQQDEPGLRLTEADPARYLKTTREKKAASRGAFLVKSHSGRSSDQSVSAEADSLPPLPKQELPPLPTAAELAEESGPGILPALDEPLPDFGDEAA
ncbi:MAG: hypothetical protein Q7Q71_11210 [Verrucomicrobiota bacterium JB023]|nr:hypothetical protein [Verrucomicrobiota bacterium JB023]